MPVVSISLRKGWAEKEKKVLLDAVHDALQEAFRIPFNDRVQRVTAFSREDFEIPPGKSDKFTVVEITTHARSQEAKRSLYAGVARRVRRIMDPKDMVIVLHELPLENFGIRGGVCAADSELQDDYGV